MTTAAAQAGEACIAASGVCVFHDTKYKKATGQWRLHPDFEAIPLQTGPSPSSSTAGMWCADRQVVYAEARLAPMLLRQHDRKLALETLKANALRIGTIAAGKRADLVLSKGDPSRNIADLENVETVFKDGVGYDSKKLIESVRGQVKIR